MSDELKDFRYYADKAEAWLETTWKESLGNDIGKAIAKAAVYAELAKAAPKAESNTPYNCSNNFAYGGVTYLCSLRYNHDGGHMNKSSGLLWRWHEGVSVSEPEGQDSKYAHISREELERSHAELQDVRNALEVAGVETVPPARGVNDLRDVVRARDAQIAELVQERANSNGHAVAEMIAYVKRHEEHSSRWWGMLDVLARFLVVMGEANDDDRHAVARRLCGIEE
jgi:hypothetical protein